MAHWTCVILFTVALYNIKHDNNMLNKIVRGKTQFVEKYSPATTRPNVSDES